MEYLTGQIKIWNELQVLPTLHFILLNQVEQLKKSITRWMNPYISQLTANFYITIIFIKVTFLRLFFSNYIKQPWQDDAKYVTQ